jgi:hypothetical protein
MLKICFILNPQRLCFIVVKLFDKKLLFEPKRKKKSLFFLKKQITQQRPFNLNILNSANVEQNQ